MATVTPNFNWPVPTSTDLVRDGATAIEALGDSIDASLVDLKGGTTGQVLSKNSNTDMDFVWVTDAAGDITGVTAGTGISGGGTSGTVTVTNSMATAIDAKGDLIAGTAADAFSRVAVGTDGQVLTADSSAAAGLAWTTASGGGTWTTFTPTWTNLTVGNGTVVARYLKVGGLVNFKIKLQWGSTTSISGRVSINWPLTPSSTESAQSALMTVQFEDSGTGPTLGTFLNATASTTSFSIFNITTGGTYASASDLSSTAPFTWTTNDQIYVTGSYEVTP